MRRLGGLDSVFVSLETPDHPLHTMALLVLDPCAVPGGYDFGRMRDFVASRLPVIPPLRRRLVATPWGLGRSRWVETDVDIGEHVRSSCLRDGTLTEVARYAASLDGVPLDRGRPLWEMDFVEGLEDGSVVLIAKVHHALMDGVGGMQFMANMFSLSPRPQPVAEVATAPERAPGSAEMLARAIPDLATTPVRVARALAKTASGVLRSWRTGSEEPGPRAERTPRLRWNGPLSSRRSVAIRSLPLVDVKAVANAGEATLNDVVLAALGGGCRAYLQRRGELPDRALVGAVPVNARGHGDVSDANAVSMLFTTLGTDVEDPKERLGAVHAAAAHAKHRHEALGPDVLGSWLEVVSPMVFAAAGRLYTALDLAAVTPPLANLIVSNVPGPPVPLYFGGACLRGLFPLGPVFDGLGLNVTVVSSQDSVGFGFVACPDVLDDVDQLASEVVLAFAQLEDAVGDESG